MWAIKEHGSDHGSDHGQRFWEVAVNHKPLNPKS